MVIIDQIINGDVMKNSKYLFILSLLLLLCGCTGSYNLTIDDNEIIGFFTMRRPNEFFEELRFGFVIVDSEKRGQGYGKKMLELGLKYAKEIFGANKVSLGVFENNKSAYFCYKATGFEDVSQDEIEKYTVMGEEWNCLELEMKL